MLCYLSTPQEFDTLLRDQSLFAVYKYNSKNCRVSERTIREVLRAVTEHDKKHIYFVDVIDRREITDHITSSAGIKHESPQILIFQDGNLTAHTSHMYITTDYILQHLSS